MWNRLKMLTNGPLIWQHYAMYHRVWVFDTITNLFALRKNAVGLFAWRSSQICKREKQTHTLIYIFIYIHAQNVTARRAKRRKSQILSYRWERSYRSHHSCTDYAIFMGRQSAKATAGRLADWMTGWLADRLSEWLTDWLDAKEAHNRVFVSKTKNKEKKARLQLGQHQWVKNSILLLLFYFVDFTFWLQLTIVVVSCCCSCLFNTFTYVDISILLCFVVGPPLVGVCLLWISLAFIWLYFV